ncbi:MAG: hypothetical protein PVF68_13445 [Acidobacteriota bacterium]|jgi:hypothetical protein
MLWARWFALCAVILACAQPTATGPRKEEDMLDTGPPSSDFSQVKLGTFLQSPCSPQFPDLREVGLRIRMPESVTLSADGGGTVPLCLAAQLTAGEMAGYRHVFEPSNVVLVDDERGETITGSLWLDRTMADPEPSELSPEEMRTIIVRKYYNVDLMERIDLPARDATYQVYATLNAHKSNVLTLEVKVR